MKIKNSLSVIPRGLVVFYLLILAGIYSEGAGYDFSFAVLVFLIAGSLALAFRQAWGRRIILVGSSVGIVYMLWQLLYANTPAGALLRLLVVIVSGAVIFFYNLAEVKKYFRSSGHLPAWTLLVIDDDRTLLKLLKTNFERNNISVLTAETGEQGLALAEQARPDLVILDVILPKMKGRMVCAKLKENPHTKDIPVIFLTAKNSIDDVHAEMAAGAHAHITKPVDFQDLLYQVKKILNA